MILSSQTNSVYFSAHLANDYRQLYEAVKSVLQDYQIHVDVLCKTADYWCRDSVSYTHLTLPTIYSV